MLAAIPVLPRAQVIWFNIYRKYFCKKLQAPSEEPEATEAVPENKPVTDQVRDKCLPPQS